MLFGRFQLISTLVNAIAFHGPWDLDLNPHVDSRKRIVTAVAVSRESCSFIYVVIPVQPGRDLILLVVGRVCQGVDVCGQAG